MILGVLQARTTSTRLPRKVLLPLLGRPMLARQIERLLRSRRIDRLVVATSVEASDDEIAALAASIGVDWRRGPLDDVLARFVGAAREWAPEHLVRLTADCPLADPELIDAVIATHLERAADYTSNVLGRRTWPRGLDVEVMRFACLEAADAEATLPSDREHVTPFLYRRPERFRLADVPSPVDLSGHRWTVDHAEDYELVRRIYEQLYPVDPAFSTADVLALLERHPDWTALNSGRARD